MTIADWSSRLSQAAPPSSRSNETAVSRALERERKARRRAEELLETRSRELYLSKQELEKSYLATVEVFASLLADKGDRSSHDLRNIGVNARALAGRAGLDDEQTRTVYLAAVLCDLGKLALPDALVDKPIVALSGAERRAFEKHPQLAHDALVALPPLEAVAHTILFHCERPDGKGYPNDVRVPDIPTESLVLAIAKDFDALQRGVLVRDRLTKAEALEYLRGRAGTGYDATLVAEFVTILETRDEQNHVLAEKRLTPRSLQPGMVVSRDLTNDKGQLVLPAGQELSERLVAKLRDMEVRNPGQILVYVRPGDDG